ncbi:MAG: phospholipase D-like domain-containing protein [Candidatus Nezhaarchaeota archaeon]|nr:phospholipase D-like domain-containing protein [Candidatus Nezhaarchaeota archaeon]
MRPTPQEVTLMLSRLGLSQREASVYLRAIDTGSISLGEASKTLGLKEDEAKALLEGMVAKGVLKPHDGAYEPSKPRDAVSSLLKLKVDEVNIFLQHLHHDASRLLTLLDQYYAERREGVRLSLLLEPLESLEAMEVRTVDMINSATNEVDIFTAGFGWLDKVIEAIYAAKSRGVALRVLMRVVDEASRENARRLLEAGVEVKSQREAWYPLRGTIVDGRRLVFLIWATERKTKYYRPHYTENEGMIVVFKEAFEKRWREAVPVTISGAGG